MRLRSDCAASGAWQVPLPFKGNPDRHVHSQFTVTLFPCNAFDSGRQLASPAKTMCNFLHTASPALYVNRKKRHEDQVTCSSDPRGCFRTDPSETLHNLQVFSKTSPASPCPDASQNSLRAGQALSPMPHGASQAAPRTPQPHQHSTWLLPGPAASSRHLKSSSDSPGEGTRSPSTLLLPQAAANPNLGPTGATAARGYSSQLPPA